MNGLILVSVAYHTKRTKSDVVWECVAGIVIFTAMVLGIIGPIILWELNN